VEPPGAIGDGAGRRDLGVARKPSEATGSIEDGRGGISYPCGRGLCRIALDGEPADSL